MRYYYKTQDETAWFNLKSPISNKNYIEITQEEFENHLKEIDNLQK